MYAVAILSLGSGGFQSCSTAEVQDFEAGSGAYFNDELGDSTNYSFANQIVEKDIDTLFINMRVMGDLFDKQRVIQLEAMEGTTAVADKDYVLPAYNIAAKQYDVKYPVILKNSAELKEKTLKLALRVAKNADFPDGSGIISSKYHYSTFLINFNNRLIKPTYWEHVQVYFGDYSDVKYRFMIDHIGVADFMPDYVGGKVGYSDLLNYAGIVRKAIQEYEEEHGPLLDEHGKEVSIPI